MSVSRSSKVPAHNVEPSLTRSSRTVVRRRSPSVWMLPSRTESTRRSRPAATGSRPGTVYFCTAPVERTSRVRAAQPRDQRVGHPQPEVLAVVGQGAEGEHRHRAHGRARCQRGVGRFHTQARAAAAATAARTTAPRAKARARSLPWALARPPRTRRRHENRPRNDSRAAGPSRCTADPSVLRRGPCGVAEIVTVRLFSSTIASGHTRLSSSSFCRRWPWFSTRTLQQVEGLEGERYHLAVAQQAALAGVEQEWTEGVHLTHGSHQNMPSRVSASRSWTADRASVA